MAWPQPTWEPIWLRCKSCRNALHDWQPNSVAALDLDRAQQNLPLPKLR